VMRTAEVSRPVLRDVHAVGAELAEVAAWSLYDAGLDHAARSMNHAALGLCRLAGDRDMERFVLQNMAMHAGDLGRPRESLNIVRLVQQRGKTPPRRCPLRVTRGSRRTPRLESTCRQLATSTLKVSAKTIPIGRGGWTTRN
jgi:hypothetical protein